MITQDIDFILKQVEKGYSILKYVKDDIKGEFTSNKELILRLVKLNGDNLQYASDRLKDDEEVALQAIKTHVKLKTEEGFKFLFDISKRLRFSKDFRKKVLSIKGIDKISNIRP